MPNNQEMNYLEWLQAQPWLVAMTISARSALRQLPIAISKTEENNIDAVSYLRGLSREELAEIATYCFRSNAVAWFSTLWSQNDTEPRALSIVALHTANALRIAIQKSKFEDTELALAAAVEAAEGAGKALAAIALENDASRTIRDEIDAAHSGLETIKISRRSASRAATIIRSNEARAAITSDIKLFRVFVESSGRFLS